MTNYSPLSRGLSLLLLFISLSNVASSLSGFRASMVHVNPTLNLTNNANRVSKFRSSLIATSRFDKRRGIKAPFKMGDSDYAMQLSVGIPPRPFWAEMDTGSNLLWTQCKPCNPCFTQPDPLFDPLKSMSFSKLSCASPLCTSGSSDGSAMCNKNTCGYMYQYADEDYTSGNLATETFKIGNTIVPGITFGCGTSNNGDYGKSSGVVGLGGGKLSLIRQLGLGKFSYCLQSDTSKINPILFGALATLKGPNAHTTPLVKDDEFSLYYVNLQGITIGRSYIPVQKSPGGPKTNKILVDSGTTYSYLITPILKLVKRAFIEQIKLPVFSKQESEKLGLDLCFITSNKPNFSLLPTMILHFEGGAKMVLAKHNYFRYDPAMKRLCLMIAREYEANIIGNIMQMDMHIVYDLDAMKFSFEPANCDHI